MNMATTVLLNHRPRSVFDANTRTDAINRVVGLASFITGLRSVMTRDPTVFLETVARVVTLEVRVITALCVCVHVCVHQVLIAQDAERMQPVHDLVMVRSCSACRQTEACCCICGPSQRHDFFCVHSGLQGVSTHAAMS